MLKKPKSFKPGDWIISKNTGTLPGLTVNTCVLLVLIALGQKALHGAPSTPDFSKLERVILTYYQAIEENQVDRAMHQFHSHSPERARTRTEIEFGLSQYWLKTITMDFCYVGQEAGLAVVIAKHRYLMISGIKFIKYFATIEYRLRRERGNWKIWAQRDSSNAHASLSGCN